MRMRLMRRGGAAQPRNRQVGVACFLMPCGRGACCYQTTIRVLGHRMQQFWRMQALQGVVSYKSVPYRHISEGSGL